MAFKTPRDVPPHKGYQPLYGQPGEAAPPVESVTVVEEVKEEASTALVPMGSQEIGEILGTRHPFVSAVQFSGSGRPPTRRLTWLTGNSDLFAANGKTQLEPAKGLFLDKPDEEDMSPYDYELWDAMEELCERGQAREIVVSYIDEKTKAPRKTPSWQFLDPSLFVVCQGVPTKTEMDKDNRCRWGIAYAWPQGAKSRLSFHCFVQQLMKVGYNGAFIASFSSYVTTEILKILYNYHQEYVLHFVDENRGDLGITFAIPYYYLTLTLRVSTKTITAGSEEGKTRQVYYPVAVIPRLSMRNLTATLAFLASARITDEQAMILECDGFVEECADWSVKETRRILEGRDFDADVAPASDGTIVLDDKDSPF